MSTATAAGVPPKFWTTSAASTVRRIGGHAPRRERDDADVAGRAGPMPSPTPAKRTSTSAGRRAPGLVAERAVADERRSSGAGGRAGSPTRTSARAAGRRAPRWARRRRPRGASRPASALRSRSRRWRRTANDATSARSAAASPSDDRVRARARRRRAASPRSSRADIDAERSIRTTRLRPARSAAAGRGSTAAASSASPAVASASSSDSRSRRRRAQLVVRRGPIASSHSGANDTTTRAPPQAHQVQRRDRHGADRARRSAAARAGNGPDSSDAQVHRVAQRSRPPARNMRSTTASKGWSETTVKQGIARSRQ